VGRVSADGISVAGSEQASVAITRMVRKEKIRFIRFSFWEYLIVFVSQ
jgi:hypothetical protein